MPDEVWYRGNAATGRGVIIEDAAGRQLGMLANLDGTRNADDLTWGYPGSGPAMTARSLLLDALGGDARCMTCGGCQNIIWPLGAEDPIPFDSAVMDACDPASVSRCYDCDGGYVRVPWMAFKEQFVARWGAEWRISRAEILAWLATHEVG